MEDLVSQWPAPTERKLPLLDAIPERKRAATDIGSADSVVMFLFGGLWSGAVALAGNVAIASGAFGVTAVVAAALGIRAMYLKQWQREFDQAVARFRRLERDCEAIHRQINDACAVRAHQKWRSATKTLRHFISREPLALAEFKNDVAERGLRQFLQANRLDQCKDSRLSQLARVRLKSAGIETAIDFDKASLDKLRLLNDQAGAAILDWKRDLVRQFNRSAPPQDPELQTFRKQRKRERTLLEAEVSDLFKQIEQARQQGALVATARENQLQTLLAERAKQHALCLELAKRLE